MGLIPDPKNRIRTGDTDSEDGGSSTDDISNFSLEIEMLNKLHVEKNNKN